MMTFYIVSWALLLLWAILILRSNDEELHVLVLIPFVVAGVMCIPSFAKEHSTENIKPKSVEIVKTSSAVTIEVDGKIFTKKEIKWTHAKPEDIFIVKGYNVWGGCIDTDIEIKEETETKE